MNDSVELEDQLKKATSDAEKIEALLELAFYHTNHDFIEGWRYGQKALELSRIMLEKESEAKAHEAIAGCLWKLTDYAVSMEHYEQALDIYLSKANLYRASKCYCGMGIIHGINEDYQLALECFEEGLLAAKKADQLNFAATITGNIGHVYLKVGRYEDAMDCYRFSKDFQEENGFKQGAADMLLGMAGVAVLQGDYDKGLELARRALEAFKAVKHERGISVGIMNVGEAQRRMGQLEEAKQTFLKALNYARSINLLMVESEVLKKLSQVCTELKDHEGSSKYLELYLASESEEKKEALRKRTEQSDRFRRVQGDLSK